MLYAYTLLREDLAVYHFTHQLTCSVHLSVCHGRKVLHYNLVQVECSVHIDSHKVHEYIFVNGQLHGLFSAVYLCKMKIYPRIKFVH